MVERHYFLLVYDTEGEALLRTEEYQDPETAEAAFARTEEEFRGAADKQVLMFSSDSLESVKATHPHYFGNGAGARHALPI